MRCCVSVIVRGGMIFTFYKARGLGVGSSLVEDDSLELAKKLEVLHISLYCPFLEFTDMLLHRDSL